MGFDLEFDYTGVALNGAFVGEEINSRFRYKKLLETPPPEPVDITKMQDPPETNGTARFWTYEYREFWFRCKSYGAWVTVGTSKQAFNTLSAGYAMENLIGKD